MKIFLFIAGFVASISCFGQGEIDSLVQVGVQYHDSGEYGKAIEVYKEALQIDPASTLVNYEIAMTYFYAGDHKTAIKHCDAVIKQNKDRLVDALIVKGSALDDLGKSKQAIKLFEQAIKEYGPHYYLYYNLGITYINVDDMKSAEQAFVHAIAENPNHASSHYALALRQIDEGRKTQSVLCLYYFLMLEPSSERAKTAYQQLMEQLYGNVQKNSDNPNNVRVVLNEKNRQSEFAASDLMLSLRAATNLAEENRDKSQDELFIENTKLFFTMLKDSDGEDDANNVWWQLYIPFFYRLVQADFVDVFCYYISLSSNENAAEWLETNMEKLENFGKWVDEE